MEKSVKKKSCRVICYEMHVHVKSQNTFIWEVYSLEHVKSHVHTVSALPNLISPCLVWSKNCLYCVLSKLRKLSCVKKLLSVFEVTSHFRQGNLHFIASTCFIVLAANYTHTCVPNTTYPCTMRTLVVITSAFSHT